jgi:hypothetical protein
MIPAGAILFLAFLGLAEGAGDKKPGTPPWAQVTVGGEIRDLIDLRAKVDVLALLDRDLPFTTVAKQWRGPLLMRKLAEKETAHIRSMQVGDAAWVVALLDNTDPEIEKTLPKLKAPAKGGLRVALNGILGASTDRDPFVAHANAYGTIRVVDQGDKKSPAFGEITVTGQSLPGKYEVSKGEFTSLAIENGPSPILITGKVGDIVGKGTIIVSGKLIVSKQGPLAVEAKQISMKASKVKVGN